MRPKSILGCQQLVELYFGVRMIAIIAENEVALDGDVDVLIGPDPRRIRYEIILAQQNAAVAQVAIGTPQSFDLGTSQFYVLGQGDTIVIERNFFDDLDAVTLPLSIQLQSESSCTVSTRETFLTPLPTDEADPITSPLS
jgi:hypothetical protein